MDYLRALLVPFQPTSLLLIGVLSPILWFFLSFAGFYGLIASFVVHVWVLKYGYVIVEHVADGATEPPVLETDMLSPFETRPWMQAAILGLGTMLCVRIGGDAGIVLAALLLLALPASVALLGMGDDLLRAMNPLAWLRVIRGMGALYVALLAVIAVLAAVIWSITGSSLPLLLVIPLILLCEIAFFSLIGSSIWLRRRQLGFEPSRSPERVAARADAERLRERAKMLDDVFQQVRLGKHVDATAPLARWLRDVDDELAVRDSLHVAERALEWRQPRALDAIGSTLIRHLLRFGRPDAALAIFELFRQRSGPFTMDSAEDLRTLADYADSVGKESLARSMRLETPVHRPT